MNERILRLRRKVKKRFPAWKKRLYTYRSLLLHKHTLLLFFASIIIGLAALFVLNIIVTHPKSFNSSKEKKNIFSFTSTKKGNCFSCKEQTTYDPYILSQKIKGNDETISIVDIRSRGEYDKGHIKNALSIPVYTSLANIEDSERKENDIANDFRKIKTPTIIIYGNAASSTLPTVVQQLLEKQGVHVTVLTIGWNEWYHMKNVWVPQDAWNNWDMGNYSITN